MEKKEIIRGPNFLEQIIEEDINSDKHQKRVHTRFPPEPNGYLHIGHAKSICLNFGIADKFNGLCNLRFDDTNPAKEEVEYIESIKKDVNWLGFQWHVKPFYSSDYFEQLYEWAEFLINKNKAYVCDLTAEDMAEQKGSPTKPGEESQFRNRSIDENLSLFRKMRNNEYNEGEKVLRAKIDMTSPNMHMRDPILYRIIKKPHHRSGDKWCIYPMYDFTHGQSDYIEGITHSICTLEFEVHKPLYNWFLDQILDDPNTYRPQQHEFARLNLSYTVMSKRKLLELVNLKYVKGWDDPRMPTISGLRRRGYTPESIRNFADKIGVTKFDGITDVALLEHSIKEDLNKNTFRKMCVLNPLKVVITNFPEDKDIEMLEAVNNPEDPDSGKRTIPFSKEIYIERNDFMEEPPKKFFRLRPGGEVRLKYAYFIKCENVIKNDDGDIIELHCTYDPETKSGMAQSTRKVKGTLHWVSVKESVKVKVNLYDRLFTIEEPDRDKNKDFKNFINPDSLETLEECYAETSISGAKPLDKFQFERLGYFCVDHDSKNNNLIINRTVTLKDSWAKIANKK